MEKKYVFQYQTKTDISGRLCQEELITIDHVMTLQELKNFEKHINMQSLRVWQIGPELNIEDLKKELLGKQP